MASHIVHIIVNCKLSLASITLMSTAHSFVVLVKEADGKRHK